MSQFTNPALWAIYRITGGYPRKIITLCHQSILSMIIQNRSKCRYLLVRTCARRVFSEESNRNRLVHAAAMALGAVAVALLIFLPSDRFETLQNQGIQTLLTILSKKGNQEVSHKRQLSQDKPATIDKAPTITGEPVKEKPLIQPPELPMEVSKAPVGAIVGKKPGLFFKSIL